MSILWTLIASFLYFEIVIVLLLVLPLASPRKWQSIFRSRFLRSIGNQASFYFYILLSILVLFLLDAIREMRKYSYSESADHSSHPHQLDLEMQVNMRLFRAQRNFYISGFALFLSLVIRRLVILISTQATLQAQGEASMKQAQSATTAARNLMSERGEAAQNTTNEAHDKEITEMKEKLVKTEKELEKVKLDRDAIKKQAEAAGVEYDRLAEECRKLQQSAGGSGDKKDD